MSLAPSQSTAAMRGAGGPEKAGLSCRRSSQGPLPEPSVSSSPLHMCRVHVCAVSPGGGSREPGPGRQSPGPAEGGVHGGKVVHGGRCGLLCPCSNRHGGTRRGGAPRRVGGGGRPCPCAGSELPGVSCLLFLLRVALARFLSGTPAQRTPPEGRAHVWALGHAWSLLPRALTRELGAAVPARLWGRGEGLGVECRSS